MAKKNKMSVTPTTAAVASAPPSSEVSAQGAMQHLKTLNSFLLKETADLREQIKQVRSELVAVSADRCIVEEMERDVCGVVVSSHLASSAEACAAMLRKAENDLAAEKAAVTETTSSLVKKADASAAELRLAETMISAVSKEKNAIERDLDRVVEERDLIRSDVDEKGIKLRYLEENLRSMEQRLISAEAECRKLEEAGKTSEESLHYAIHEMSSLKRLLDEKNVLMVKLTGENEKMEEEGKIREESLQSLMLNVDYLRSSLEEKNNLIVKLQNENEKLKEEGRAREELLHSAMGDTNSLNGLLEEKIHLTTQLVKENEEVKSRKEAEIKLLNAEIESNASKIFSLEENCCNLNKVRNILTDEVSDLKSSLDLLKETLMDAQKKSKCRNLKWLYPAATAIFVVVFLGFAARAR